MAAKNTQSGSGSSEGITCTEKMPAGATAGGADIVVVGGGMVGALTALAMAHCDLNVTVIEQSEPRRFSPERHDIRVSAISHATQQMFKAVGAWQYMFEARVCPYSRMRVWDSMADRKAVFWAGALIQEPHFELGYQRGNFTPGVFISATRAGSPAIQDNLYRNRFVTEVDGVAVQSIDEFVTEISRKEPSEPVNLTVIAMNGYRSVVSVQPEYNFWPTVEVSFDGEKWQRKTLSPDQVAARE